MFGGSIQSRHLTGYLQRNAKDYPEKAAIVFEGRSISWRELWQKVEAGGSYISTELNADRQQVVQLLLPNSIDFIVGYLSILHSGHIAFPLDPAYKKLELDAIIESVPSKLMLSSHDYREKIGRHNNPLVTVRELTARVKTSKNHLRISPTKQIASLTFTSGTTGKPKAVPNTHANHIWNIEVCSSVWQWTSKDSLLISLPLSHWYGAVMGLSGALYHGNTLHLNDWFDEQRTLETLGSGDVTFFTHISQAYLKLLETKGEYDLSKVRLCVSGGAPLPPEVWRQFKTRFGIEILETYGSSETGRIAANNPSEHALGSPGKVLPGVDLRLSANGEVQIKSPGVFPGYFQNSAATEAGFTKDGYFKTGDIAELKEEYIYLKGRRYEQIRRFGYTISPRDVEWAMHLHPKIKDIYVMGSQTPGKLNDELIYFVVGPIKDDELIAYAKQNLIFAWRPDKILHLKSLPKTSSGKPRVAEFRNLVGAGI